MNSKVKFFSVVTTGLLLSSLLLVGSMCAIAANNGEGKSYQGHFGNEIVAENAPTAQAALKAKFHPYLHKEGKTVTVFSPQQYAELKAVRESGRRNPLSADEISFLVNDSISLYFTCDEIYLTNASADGILSFLPQRKTVSFTVIPYRGNFSEYKTYAEATEAYNAMLGDIFAIFYYRIYMHDAGFARIWHYNKFSQGDAFFTEGDPRHSDANSDNSDLSAIYQCLVLDGSRTVDSNYREKLLAYYENLYELEKQIVSYQVPVYYVPYEFPALQTGNLISSDPSFSLACGEDILFPTNELRYMKPEEKTLYVADLPQFEASPIFYLNYETRTFKAEAKSGTGFYFTLCGSFEETDGNLTLLVDGFEHFQGTSHLDITMVYEPLEANKYWYLLKKTKNGYLYSAEGSSPYVTTATSVKDGLGFEWKDGTVFVKSIAAWNDQ